MRQALNKYYFDKNLEFGSAIYDRNLINELKNEIIIFEKNKETARTKMLNFIDAIEKGMKVINCSIKFLNEVDTGIDGLYKNSAGQINFRQCRDDVVITGNLKYLGKQLKPIDNYHKAIERLSRLEKKFNETAVGARLSLNPFSIKDDIENISFTIYIK